ncbi:hypothetical protein P4T04_10035 [Bacillus badius]|uniref:hypothetical protein n=1 Tax=Bacillus badius TaxID=1455 RepID=UPI002E225C26|nr:hypothetical protein [Bacillus badius]
MNDSILSKLGKVIHQSWEKKSIDAKKEINKILHRKSNKRVIKELNIYIKHIKGSQKNIAVMIVVLSLLKRNLDCVDELAKLLKVHNLVSQLYGGLVQLLSGKSSQAVIKIKWNDYKYPNKYQFIHRFPAPEYWTYIDLFQAAEIIYKTDSSRFEKLLIADSTNLLLLNLASGSLEASPSEALIINLLNDKDYLRKNIGFSLLVSLIESAVNRFKLNSTQEDKIYLDQQVQKTTKILQASDNLTQIDLLVNYFLYNKYESSYLSSFATLLMNKSLQDELIQEISSGSKIRTLEDIRILLIVVKNTPIINSIGKHASKDSLYRAFINRIKSFLNNNIGVYSWGANEIQVFTDICNLFPKRHCLTLKNYINRQIPKLMTTELDELIRFKLFLEDKRKKEILSGMLDVIDAKLNV